VKARPFLQAAGIATLYILPIAARFLDPGLNEGYHHPHPISSVPLAMLAMTLLVWLVSWLAFLVIEGLSERWRNLASVATAVLFIGLLIRILMFVRRPTFAWMLALHVLYGLLVLVPVVLLVSLRIRKGFFTRSVAAVGVACCIAGFGMLVLLPRLAIYGFRSEPREQTSFNRNALPAQHANSRIVWILMDELSYDQTFDHRQPGISLPNFDAFRKQSVSFSDMQPTGTYTEDIVPGLLIGEPIRELKTPFNGQVSLREVSGAWHLLDQQNTIFAEAWKLGWNPGVAGWYNPYCRLFPDVLVRCSWQFSDEVRAVEVPLSYDKSVAQNMLALLPVRTDIEFIFRHNVDNSAHRRDYEGVMKNAGDLLRDQRIRFAFLHVPVPHPPGIYDRTTHQLSSHGDYLDNLVLADDTLGTLMKILRSTGNDQQTTIIVSSDHSWRTPLWKGGWTAEEERVTNGGKFDDRPVLMVHLPGADTGELIAKPVSALSVHTILQGLLRDEIHDSTDLDHLIDRQPQETIAAQVRN
jgi:hypothetical protein